MRLWSLAIVVLAAGALAAEAGERKTSVAEPGAKMAPGEPANGPKIWLRLADGTQVVGAPTTGDAARFEFSFGAVEIKFNTVRSIDFSKGLDAAKIKFLNGDTLTGKALFGPLRIRTLFGDLEVPPEYLLAISSDAPPPRVETPTRALVLHLPLEGDCQDEGPYGRHGKAMGGVTFVETASGKAAKLNGSDAWIVIDHHPKLQLTGSMTIAFWMQFNGSAGGSTNPVHKAWGGEGSISLEANGAMHFYYGTTGTDSGNYATLSYPQPLPTGAWVHVCVVRDVKMMKMGWYINGKPAGEAAAQLTAVAGPSPWTLGNGYNGRPMNGMLKDVRLYSRALSASEIASLVELHGDLLTERGRGDGKAVDALPIRPGISGR
jgi:hypothetical protein